VFSAGERSSNEPEVRLPSVKKGHGTPLSSKKDATLTPAFYKHDPSHFRDVTSIEVPTSEGPSLNFTDGEKTSQMIDTSKRPDECKQHTQISVRELNTARIDLLDMNSNQSKQRKDQSPRFCS
jgi:hypothetical protein